MAAPAQGQTASGTTPSGTGPAAGQGASNPDGTGTPTVEELQGRLAKSESDRVTLQQSVQGLTPYKAEAEGLRTRVTELEGVGEGTNDEDLLTRAQGTQMVSDGIKAYTAEQSRLAAEQGRLSAAWQTEVSKWGTRTSTEFPEAMDPNSALYKKAQEIYNDPNQGLSKMVSDQTGRQVSQSTTSSAEYDAFSRAKLALSTQAATSGNARDGATFASTGGSSGGSPTGNAGKMTDEEFLKMSPEQQVKYQEEQFATKT